MMLKILPLWVLVLSLMAGLIGCDGQAESPSPSRAAASSTPLDTSQCRVVTLAPALSQMLVDMSLSQQVVGISQYDLTAVSDRPVVGNFLDINTERLLSLHPTHVAIMVGKGGIPASLRQLQQTVGFQLLAYDYPYTLKAVGDIVLQLGNALDQGPVARRLHHRMFAELHRLKKLIGSRPPLKVLPVIGTNPVMASGPGSVLDELVRLLGGTNVAGKAKVSAPTLDREKLLAMAPDVILLLIPGAPPLTGDWQDPRLVDFAGLPIPAVQQKRILLVNDPLTFLPATSLPRIARALAVAMYPQLKPRIEALSHGS